MFGSVVFIPYVCLMKEIYKDIPNYEGLYQISNLGNLRSLGRMRSDGRHFIKGQDMSPSIHSKGYYIVHLTNSSSIRKTFFVHKLVALCFIGERPEGLVIDHIDNNPANNSSVNLQYTSYRVNNSKDKKGYSSRYTGVCWNKNHKKWYSQITVKGKVTYLGHFDCEIEAHEAYQNKLKEISK